MFTVADANPFYIVVSPEARVSGEGFSSYDLCHLLNVAGACAYIVHYPPRSENIRNFPNYATVQQFDELPQHLRVQMITQEILDYFSQKKLAPIVIYDDFFDNPLKASFYGRFVGSPEAAAAIPQADEAHFIISVSPQLKQALPENLLSKQLISNHFFLFDENLQFWREEAGAGQRRGSCVYVDPSYPPPAELLKALPQGFAEITQQMLKKPNSIRELFQHSETFYCAKDSPLIYRAILCGCPVAILADEKSLDKFTYLTPLTGSGVYFAGDAQGLQQARHSLHAAQEIIINQIRQAPEKIAQLAQTLREGVSAGAYDADIDYPYRPHIVLFGQEMFSDQANNISYAPRIGDQGLNVSELPYVSLPTSVIGDIAREVMFEQQRWSWSYKFKSLVAKLFSELVQLLRRN